MQGISYLTGKHCCVLIISAEKARKHGIDSQSNVLVEETENGFSVVNNRITEGSSDPQTDTYTEDTNDFDQKRDVHEDYR